MPSIATLVFVAIVFFFAGWVKGVVGMGLPTVAMGALALVMAPVEAAALLVIPSLVTNVWQFAAGPAARGVLRRLAWMMACLCAGTAVGIGFMLAGSAWPSIALGAVLAAYSLLALRAPKLAVPARLEARLSPPVGFFTGILAGATGIFAVPAVPYLSALGFTRDELVQALGLSFTVSTLALGVALAAGGRYPQTLLAVSAAAVLPALLGMRVGQRTRERIEPAAFRRWFFRALLLVGAAMVAKGLLAP